MRSPPSGSTIANPGTTHRHRVPDAGHDLALGRLPVAHQPRPAIIGQLVGMAAEEARNLGLHGLRQQRSRAVAQQPRSMDRKTSLAGTA